MCRKTPSIPGTEFGTLLAYGKFIAGLGWFIVIAGIIVLLVMTATAGVLGVIVGASLAFQKKHRDEIKKAK